MTAHDPTGHTVAHGTLRPTHINVDATGLSMSWKTAVAVVWFVVMAMLAWNTFSSSLAKSSDLTEHIKRSDKAHESLSAEIKSTVSPVRKQIEETAVAVISVQNGFYEARAEDLAYRAVEAMPERTPARERIDRFSTVKRRAVDNLKAGKDIRDGIADLSF